MTNNNQPYKGPINQPCSACSAGDTAMEYHNHDYVDIEHRRGPAPTIRGSDFTKSDLIAERELRYDEQRRLAEHYREGLDRIWRGLDLTLESKLHDVGRLQQVAHDYLDKTKFPKEPRGSS